MHRVDVSVVFFVRALAGVERAGVPGALWVPELGVDLEVVGPRKGVLGKAAWCGAPSTEALYGAPSWRPEAAVRRAQKEERAAAAGESVAGEEEPGRLGRTPRLSPVEN